MEWSLLSEGKLVHMYVQLIIVMNRWTHLCNWRGLQMYNLMKVKPFLFIKTTKTDQDSSEDIYFKELNSWWINIKYSTLGNLQSYSLNDSYGISIT